VSEHRSERQRARSAANEATSARAKSQSDPNSSEDERARSAANETTSARTKSQSDPNSNELQRAKRNRARGGVNRAVEVIRYRERLRTPWWWYPIGIGVASLLAGEFHISGLPLTDWIPFGVLVPAAILIIWALGRGELAISDEELRVRGAHISLRYISGAVALDANTLRRVVGREGDPQAFVSIRPWIGPGVQLWLDDADDPTPYWVVSTRHPARVVGLIRELIA
jgi:hypothetical protein